MHREPDLAGGLHAIDRRDVALGEEFAPARVHQDHQLGDQLVERRTALARHDAHAIVLDVKAVVDQRQPRARPATLRFQRERDAPELAQLLLVREARRGPGFERLVQHVVLRMTQVRSDGDAFHAAVRRERQTLLGYLEVQRYRRLRGAVVERKARDRVVGQHGVLAARHVCGRKAFARERIERRARSDAERRRSDVDAHTQHSRVETRHRERVVDLRGAELIEAEGGALRERQVLRGRRHSVRRKTRAARKELVQEALEVVLVRVVEQAATLEEPCRAEPAIPAGLLQGARLRLVAVRRVKQLVLQRGNFPGTLEARERLRPRLLLGEHALFLFQAGERELEGRLGRRLEAALAAALEVHRRAVQLEQDAGRLDRTRLAPDVLASESLEVEFRRAGALPQKVDLEAFGKALRLGEQLARGWLLEAEKHAGGPNLGAPAVRALHLERGRGLREHRSHFELALLLVQHVHVSTPQSSGRVPGRWGNSADRDRLPAPPP